MRLTDEDGIDGPFNKAMSAAVRREKKEREMTTPTLSRFFDVPVAALRGAEEMVRVARLRVVLAACVEMTPCLGRPPTVTALAGFLVGKGKPETWAAAQLAACRTFGALGAGHTRAHRIELTALSVREATGLIDDAVTRGLAEITTRGHGLVLTARGRRLVEVGEIEQPPVIEPVAAAETRDYAGRPVVLCGSCGTRPENPGNPGRRCDACATS